jgi:hypothetical protein
MSDPDDPVVLWAEIHRLRAEVAGPDGYPTWKDAATIERVKRVKAEREAEQLRALLTEAREMVGYLWPSGTRNRLLDRIDAALKGDRNG